MKRQPASQPASQRRRRRRSVGEQIITFLAVSSLLVYPLGKAFAPEMWIADLTANTTSGLRSKSISLTWDTDYPEIGCNPTRLMIRYNKLVRGSATPPDMTDTSDGYFLTYEPTSSTSHTHGLVHAATNYAYTIYPCSSATGCTSLCTNVLDTKDNVTTQFERWVARGVNDYDQDTDARILSVSDWPTQSSPELYRFSNGTYGDQGAVYFAGQNAAGEPPGIYVIHTDADTWQENFNDPDEWLEPIALAQTTTDGAFDGLRNVMVVPTEDSSDNFRMRLFWTSHDGVDQHVHSLLSTSGDGDDFGLCCSDTGDCSSTETCILSPYSEICCDYEDTAVNVRTEFTAPGDHCLTEDGWHGHDLWDDLGPRWEPSDDELAILFSGDPTDTASGCENCYFPATGSRTSANRWYWDTGGGCDTGDSDTAAKFCLAEVEEDDEDTGTSWCPDRTWDIVHDPAALNYPDEVKIYVKKSHSLWLLGYSSDNGRTLEDTSAIEFYFEDEDTGDTAVDTDDVLDPGCVEDITIMAWKEPGTTREIMVFIPYSHVNGSDNRDRCFSTQDTDLDEEDTAYQTFGGFVSAVLGNG